MPALVRARQWLAGSPPLRDGLLIAGLGGALRLWVVLWAARRFPPAEDGRFYDVVAWRIAEGDGYTWLWPDGVVTFAAHYPVGYPAAVGLLYAVFGPAPLLAMLFNAGLGTLCVLAAHRIAASLATRGGAALGALLVALHPALVFYTPALMTEGVACAAITLAAWLVVRGRKRPEHAWRTLFALGLVLGSCTLLRPQLIMLAPVMGALLLLGPPRPGAASELGARDPRPFADRATRRADRPRWLNALVGALLVSALALLVCLPWTLRNCTRMGQCVFVSANGGWNLLIGAGEGATGSWVPIEQAGMPPECRTVYGEAEKDACFGRAARAQIAARPIRWLALVPAKLSATFDYVGAAAWYLHSSNPGAFDERQKLTLGVAETAWHRAVVLIALLALARAPGPRRKLRVVTALTSALWLFLKAAWVAHLGLLVAAALLGRKTYEQYVPAALAGWLLLTTAFTHAVFFGAGRYALVSFGLLSALAGTCAIRRAAAETEALTDGAEPGDTRAPRMSHAAD